MLCIIKNIFLGSGIILFAVLVYLASFKQTEILRTPLYEIWVPLTILVVLSFILAGINSRRQMSLTKQLSANTHSPTPSPFQKRNGFFILSFFGYFLHQKFVIRTESLLSFLNILALL